MNPCAADPQQPSSMCSSYQRLGLSATKWIHPPAHARRRSCQPCRSWWQRTNSCWSMGTPTRCVYVVWHAKGDCAAAVAVLMYACTLHLLQSSQDSLYLRTMLDCLRIHHVASETPLAFVCPLSHQVGTRASCYDAGSCWRSRDVCTCQLFSMSLPQHAVPAVPRFHDPCSHLRSSCRSCMTQSCCRRLGTATSARPLSSGMLSECLLDGAPGHACSGGMGWGLKRK